MNIKENTDGTCDITVKCFCCGQLKVVQAKTVDFHAWQHGKFAQDAFPYLNAGKRELLISRTCETCFDEMFPAEEYE
jgi:hypothetical protein